MSEASPLTKPVRNVSLDLLRIVAMLMIVASHCIGHGGISNNLILFSPNYFIVWIANTFFNVHVNCYVLISGYFLCEGKFKLNKLFSLYGSAWFWSVALFAVFCAFGVSAFSMKGLVKVCLPFTQQAYWFLTTYLLMYILSPFLNIVIHSMSKKQHAAAIAVFFALYICLQNLTFWNEFTNIGSHDPLFFMFLYFVAAYIRRYPTNKKHPWILLYVSCTLLTAASRFALTWITTPIFGKPIGETAFYSYNSIFMVLGSVGLFLFFRELNIKSIKLSKLIVSISPLTFGVYLIHDNNNMRAFLWNTILKPSSWTDSSWILLLIIVASISIFAVCCCIERVRLLLRRLLHIDRAVNLLADKTKNIFTKICQMKPIRAFWEDNT